MKKLQLIIVCLLFKLFAVCQNFIVTSSTNNNVTTSGQFDCELSKAINQFNLPGNPNPNQIVTVRIVTPGPINLNPITQPIALTNSGTFRIIYAGTGIFQGLIVAPISGWLRNIYAVGNPNNTNQTFKIDNLKFIQPPAVNPSNPYPMIQCDKINKVVIENTLFLESYNPIVSQENTKLTVSNCTMTSTFGGGIGIYYYDEFFNSPNKADLTINDNKISNYYKGIVLRPLACVEFISPSIQTINDYAHNNGLQNASVNTDMQIYNNTITAWGVGIHQERIPSDRTTTADASYKLLIDGNTIKSNHYCIGLAAPYRHFKLTNNTLSLQDSSNAYTFASFLNDGGLSYGNMPIAFTHLVLGVNYLAQGNNGNIASALYFKNQFGFDMIYPGSTIPGLNPVNNNNTFNVLPSTINPNQPTSTPHIQVFGKPKNKINFIKMPYPGRIVVFGGETTNIRECTFNPIHNAYTGFPNAQKISPIILDSLRYLNASNLTYNANPANTTLIRGNLGINAPILKAAKIQGSLLSVAFDLAGTQIIPQNGPFVVEFFRSDITGALTDFVGKQTITTLTGLTYSLTLVVPNTVILNQGDRIGATVTSLATNGNPPTPLPVGTSEVGYIYSDPPCTNCISDFAPIPGKDYIISCWTKSDYFPTTTYDDFQIKVTFYTALSPLPVVLGTPVLIGQSGPMIDDWQKIEGKVSVPANATGIKIEFVTLSGYGAYVDDVRVFPVDATMKSYAYDPDNMRLMGELDERNYATFYEYDEEGKLIRVKKETEKGIMTVKESRNSKPTK